MKFYKIVNKHNYQCKNIGYYSTLPDAVWRALQIVEGLKHKKSDYIIVEGSYISVSLDIACRLIIKVQNINEMRKIIDEIKVKKIIEKLKQKNNLLMK